MNKHLSVSGDPWTVVIDPFGEDIQELRRNLKLDNLAKIGRDKAELNLAIFLRDASENMVAGITGMLWGDTMEIDYLWVDESFRGKGTGARLVLSLEKSASDRGCTTSITNIFSFQALGFYQKLGYEIFGTIPGFGGRYKKYFLRKSL